MASVNKVIIMGNLGQDPELRYTTNQTPVATLSLATTDYRKAPDGSRQEMTEWHRIVVWGKQAENCSKYLSKGRPVFVEGRLQTRSWEDQNGNKRYSTEVVAQNVQFLGAGGNRGEQGMPIRNGQQASQDNQMMGGFSQEAMPPQGGSSMPDFDDIPF